MAAHNKYTVGYCNPYGNVAVLGMSMRICKINGWQDIIQLMIGFFMSPGKRERGFYICPTINRDRKTQQYTTYWILQFMWECGRRIYICADRWVEKILQYSYVTVAKYTMFEVNGKRPGKMGAQTTTKTGMVTKLS